MRPTAFCLYIYLSVDYGMGKRSSIICIAAADFSISFELLRIITNTGLSKTSPLRKRLGKIDGIETHLFKFTE